MKHHVLRSMRNYSMLGLHCALAILLAGCGGTRDKGKNADFDRPKATEKK